MSAPEKLEGRRRFFKAFVGGWSDTIAAASPAADTEPAMTPAPDSPSNVADPHPAAAAPQPAAPRRRNVAPSDVPSIRESEDA